MELETPPALGPLYLRALLDRRPARMPAGRSVPRLEGRLAPQPVVADHLERYRAICGFAPGPHLPVTYPQVLASGLQMRLLGEPAFPVRLAGLVHVRQLIRQREPLSAASRPALDCWLEGSRETEAGEEFCLYTRATVGGAASWEGETYFIARAAGRRGGSRGGRPDDARFATTEHWEVPADIGRRYARVSGDYNPIHLWPLTGRLLGFPGAIAHGMWSLARVLAALGARTEAACVVEARFLRPLVLPAAVELQLDVNSGETAFRLVSGAGETAYLSGRVAGI